MTRQEIQDKIDDAFNQDSDDLVLVDLPASDEPHVLDGPLRLKPGVHLQGAGSKTVLTTTDRNVNLIELDPGNDTAAHDITISRLHLVGPSDDPDITQAVSDSEIKGCGILASTRQDPNAVDQVVRNIVIEECVIKNVSGCGIRFDTRQDILVEKITIKDCQLLQNRRPPESGRPDPYKDIYFYGTRFQDIRLEGNTCSFTHNNLSLYGNDSGIAFVNNFDNFLTDETGKVVTDETGARVLKPRDEWRLGFVKNVVIRNNECHGHRRHGIIINYGNLVAENVDARDNVCRNNRWVGLYVNTMNGVDDGRNVDIQNNTCEHNGYGGFGDPTAGDASIRGGIVLNGCYNSHTIKNNHCNGNGNPSEGFKQTDDSARHAAGIRVRGKNLTIGQNETKNNKGGTIVEWPEPFENVTIQKPQPATATASTSAVGETSTVVNKEDKNGNKGCLFAFLPF